MTTPVSLTYPSPAYLKFCPGGITYAGSDTDDHWYDLGSYSQSTRGKVLSPDLLAVKAREADDALRSTYTTFHDDASPYYLPSLSVLAGASFGRLTGVPSTAVRKWADAMVLSHYQGIDKIRPNDTSASILKQLLQQVPSNARRPCGYVFKRGDIAWNCRTCQTDSTCVICDNCFRNSNHEGHEVYFHRTTPGGCCDCGDAEAWAVDGCCSVHRPDLPVNTGHTEEDAEEAVRMMYKGQRDGLETLTQAPTKLPPKFAAALGVVIGAAVHCLVQAADGSGIGADAIQWKLRWADEACRIQNGVCHDEEYCLKPSDNFTTPRTLTTFPQLYQLQLRLHNDDVHTFDEVIEALHEPRNARRSSDDNSPSLVARRDEANEMTHHVDADGQVTVKSYPSIHSAFQGFRRLKTRGLHCAVVSTAQVDMELRARTLSAWLAEISAAHPAAAVLVVHALVQVSPHHDIGGVQVWHEPRLIPAWVSDMNRFQAFPPNLASSYVTRDEAERLHCMALERNVAAFVELTGADPNFYSNIPYRLPSERYRKSPHAIWGTLPALYCDNCPPDQKHPLIHHLVFGRFDGSIQNKLTELAMVVDTDLRKQQETDRIISSVYAHKLPGLHMISGVGFYTSRTVDRSPPPLPNPMEWRHLLETCSFRAPVSPIVLLLLLDPYPTKQLRSGLHALFLSLLIDPRFKCRFAAALGGISYRPLSTLFCAGVGTDADTPLGFTVQIFTAGSLIRALGSATATEKLLKSDFQGDNVDDLAAVGTFTLPIGHSVVRCIHTNLLGATKEVQMILKNAATGNDDDSNDDVDLGNSSLLPALTYVAGEHPLTTQLPVGQDDGFLDSRSTRHKRLPHLLRDLEYVIETPGTAIRLLLPRRFPVHPGLSPTIQSDDLLPFATVWARLLRTAQGMDLQKRKISGGHVEYEQTRWLEAFGLSLNFAGTRDALAESLTNSSSATVAPVSADGFHLVSIHEAMGNLFTALLRELKFWLYFEGVLETGLPLPPGGTHGGMDLSQIEALQRSTLHVSNSQLGGPSLESAPGAMSNVNAVALSCATSVKMTEGQLELIESALRIAGAQRQYHIAGYDQETSLSGPAMGDWLRVPHSPLVGDSLSFHLPLHRALAKSVRSLCCVVVPDVVRNANPKGWWKLPVIDDGHNSIDSNVHGSQHPLVALIRPTLRSANCRVVWSAGPECTSTEAQRRRSRAKTVSANIASAKIIHSLADHPLRCLAAAQQIERHLWARNGTSVAGMALNYSSAPLCRSFRDLDLTLVQFSAAGLSIGLGARRVFNLLLSRFSMDGYLCDPERRLQGNASSPPSSGGYGPNHGGWVNPPRLQDPDHAVALSESFFTTVCLLVTELPAPPPTSSTDDMSLRQSIRRELLHALAAKPLSHSEAMEAATSAANRRDENVGVTGTSGGGGVLGDVFADVLREIGKQKNQGTSRASSGPPAFELRAECCDEYDPTFFHLRRQEHQHAMDTVARLRRQKANGHADSWSLPIVCPPPKAHPRFLPCRLLLHLQPMDAALRRSLLFALTGGLWLPPPEPEATLDESSDDVGSDGEIGVTTTMTMTTDRPLPMIGDAPLVPLTQFGRRSFSKAVASLTGKRSFSDSSDPAPFSPTAVAASSVSFLEVLQLLTLQVHTLEECASLHRMQPDLDDEARSLSAGLSINSYLGRLIRVPDSLTNVWALKKFPEGPLPSKGSGENRGSILGLLIALYEHRSDHGGDESSRGKSDSGHGDDGHGGARTLAASGLKWLLRFVNALVDGAASVSAAARSAASGNPIRGTSNPSISTGDWSIDPSIRSAVSGMLANLGDLWPVEDKNSSGETADKLSAKGREARKAAQMRVMDMMKKKQSAFAATIAPSETSVGTSGNPDGSEGEAHICIICRCDDADGENNGPLGYLGHVQRSRATQMRASTEAYASRFPATATNELFRTYRVVGHRGCQLRATQAMDSEQLVCLPTGTIVTVEGSTVSENYDVLSRRVLVRHVSTNIVSGEHSVTEGWASVQSSEGYVILSPLSSLCYANTRWGSTRPIIRQCGHAAHLKCVETHTLSLHQRAAGEQPYDGRFAANIDDGEFLCPLCKQLSNILIPRDGCGRKASTRLLLSPDLKPDTHASLEVESLHVCFLRKLLTGEIAIDESELSDIGQVALQQFGDHLLQAMDVPWERTSDSKKRKQDRWHHAIQRWDYEDGEDDSSTASGPFVRKVLRLLRQQHISWAAVGHTAAAAEASARGVEEVLPFGVFPQTSDPWADYTSDSKDTHPMLLELSRTLTATSGLLEVLRITMEKVLSQGSSIRLADAFPVVGFCLANILEGRSWVLQMASAQLGGSASTDTAQWSQLTALMASIPCHVSRDGTISQRHEARAAAAAMWTIKGLGTKNSIPQDVNAGVTNPPTPYAIRQVHELSAGKFPDLLSNWGTMEPYIVGNSEETKYSMSDSNVVPFRPGVASAFLYMPLLTWDLNTLAGAVFSTMLANDVANLPDSGDLLLSARTLLIGRMIQAIITPCGYELSGDCKEEDALEFWTAGEIQKEKAALARIVLHCRSVLKSRSLKVDGGDESPLDDTESLQLFGAVGRAILPFARSLLLMLRACTSAIRERKRKSRQVNEAGKLSLDEKVLASLLESDEVMSYEDGFLILKQMGGPLPSHFKCESVSDIEGSSIWSLMNRWLLSTMAIELHHGSRGNHAFSGLSIQPVDAPLNGQAAKFDDPSDKKGISEAVMSSSATLPQRSSDHVIETSDAQNGQMNTMEFGLSHTMADAEEGDDEDMEEAEGPVEGASTGLMEFLDDNEFMDDELEDSDDDMEETDDAEEMVGFTDQVMGDTLFAAGRHTASADAFDDTSDDHSGSNSAIGDKEREIDREFACVSRSPIVPYQPSLLALEPIGLGRRGAPFEFSAASAVMCDLSHLGIIHRKDSATKCLIRLPNSFVELYSLVNRVRGREDASAIDDTDDSSGSETAICLLTGAVMRSGSPRRAYSRLARPPGACTLHARQVGSGIGVFFLVQKCTVLLMHNNKSAYSASLYVDQHGEEDHGLRRGRPLFLNEARFRALETLWRQQGIPREVAQIRSTSDRVIRDNWY